MTVEIDESDRQMILLGIAGLSLRRPGWESALRSIALDLRGEDMFDEFRRVNADLVKPDHLLGKVNDGRY